MTGSRGVAEGATAGAAAARGAAAAAWFAAAVALGAILALAVTAPALAEDDLRITMSFDRNEVAVGEPFTVSVEVEHGGVGRAPQPELPPVEGLRVVNRSTSQNFAYVNGKATSAFEVRYVMVGDEEGEFTIGPATATKNDVTVQGPVRTVKILPAGSSARVNLGDDVAAADTDRQDLIVLGQVDNETPYVNEQITYTFTFLYAVRLLQSTTYTPPSTVGFWTEDLDQTSPKDVVLEGRRYRAERVRVALFPTGPGEHQIGEAFVKATVPDSRRRSSRRRDPFDLFGSDPFGFFGGGREVALQTDPVTVNVKPLPVEGKPANFTGAVGQFRLSASADRTDLAAGEPVTLKVVLAGRGNLKVVPAPDLTELDGFKIYESTSSENSEARGAVIEGRKVWEWVIVPTTGGLVEIPSIEMAVFDPEAEEYVQLTTAAIPLEVEATGFEEALQGGDPALAKERVRLRQRDIRWVKEDGALRAPPEAPWTSPLFLAAHVLPIVAFAGSAFYRRHRDRLRRDTRYARRRGAGKAASKRLAASEKALASGEIEAFWGDLSSALRGYVADRLHLAAASLDDARVREGLSRLEVSGERVEQLLRLLDRCDGARFSPIGTDPAAARQALDQAREWIQEVERR